MTMFEDRTMRIRTGAAAGMTCIAMALALATPATAQGRGGGGQGGGMQDRTFQRDMVRTPSQDQDRQRAQDKVRDPSADRDQIRDRDQIQDRDQMRDRTPLYLGSNQRLNRFDGDGNGQISRNEYQAWHGDAFGQMDMDNNGLSLGEYLGARLGAGPVNGAGNANAEHRQSLAQERKSVRFRLMDGNGDGVVTRTEFMKFGELNYLDADANDDGILTTGELQAFQRGQ